MKSISEKSRTIGFTLTELLFAVTASAIFLGALILGLIAMRKSMYASNRYITAVNNQTRIMDYIAEDLRRAVRVGTLVSGVNTALKNNSVGFSITDTTILTINIPDYYASNTRNNAYGSTFKTSRYSRATLDTSVTYNSNGTGSILNGVIPWTEATTTVGSVPATRFAPTTAGNGEIQVRYYRGPRSAHDSTVCFFRAEYPSNSNTPYFAQEIAERIMDGASTVTVKIFATTTAPQPSVFRLQSAFNSEYTKSRTTIGTEATVVVTTRNTRRD